MDSNLFFAFFGLLVQFFFQAVDYLNEAALLNDVKKLGFIDFFFVIFSERV